MDIRKIKKLIEVMEDSNIGEIEIHEGEESVRLTRATTDSIPFRSPPEVSISSDKKSV